MTLPQRVVRTAQLFRVLSVREFRTRYRQSALDVAWSFINPIVIMLVYGVILSGAFRVSGDGVPYLTFAWAGLVLWTFFAAGMSGAVSSLVSGADLMSKVYFPREVVPLSVVGSNLVDLGIGVISVFVLALVQGVHASVTVLGIVFPLALLVIWTAALGVFGAACTVFLRDINHAVLLFLRVGFFAAPVMYPVATLPTSLQWTASANPIAVVIESFRDTALRGRWPDWPIVLGQLALGGLLLGASVLYVRAVEDRMVDVV
jgi:ABC-type polysaccharide/polyol phosphate export permease